MPARTAPSSFKAGRALTLEGTAYAVGDTVPKAVVARAHNVDGLLSRRYLIPNVEAYPRKGDAARKAKPRPTSLNPQERRTLLA